ncbi:MAG TPA: B12-binding domain-containing radical SAM protein, partial [Chloroflexi bacterium]|nr:B12-binding domain-containing radical SAM protein [Chloroflexota bacterium]
FLKTFVDKPSVLSHVARRYGRYGLPLEVFDEELENQPHPDVILVTSGMTYWYLGPFEAIKRARARFPDVPVVLGGVYATLCPEHARQNSGADYVVQGEGEAEALRLADALMGNQSDLSRYTESLDSLPWPLHELRRDQGFVAIQTSRGCPFRCTYCASALLHPQGFRRRSPNHVADEIEHCWRVLGIRDFAFYDDALLVDEERHLHVILDQTLERQLSCRFHTPNGLHARYVDHRLAGKMFRAGFKTIRLGLETSHPLEQELTGAKITNQEFRHAVQALKDAGFRSNQITAYVLMGLPGQSVRSVSESVAFVHSCGVRAQIAECSLIPGTTEWVRAVHQGLFAPQADPLLHNGTAYPLPWFDAEREAFEKVKLEALAGNRQLTEGS